MRERQPALLITFATTDDAMAAEARLIDARAPGRIIPMPRIIRASCGLSWKAEPEDRARLLAILARAGIPWEDALVIDF